ncbi:MAG TPA: HPr family phosphocarrier protein [Spongiibacteraceae bacterium]|nr:phosphocarrier protein HPr [Spongiibacteraceae bacterium]HCS29699.1 HPr family phosphocarrier protein [Spongiibacteraceae bacterium]|tara:strand:+ start:520 stop:789 length:270 start_codon:yes stop_codon:yes gene_type:complete
MAKTQLTIINKLGLHARAAAKLVSTASSFGSRVSVSANGQSVDGKSIMSVMMLAAAKGTDIELECSGDDEQEALDAIVSLINNRFDEAE